jgi:DNA-binding NarL/FixJ family response regulator
MSGGCRPHSPILVVEDDAEYSARLSRILEGAGYVSCLAASGEEALESAREQTPALVLLDICLPGISGYQVCRELRERFGEGLPIVFVSGSRKESYDRVAGLLVGGDDYLVKPVAPDELLIRVSRLIRRSVPLASGVAAKLTKREQEVLRMLADGLGPADIATRLFLSPKTVTTHIDHLIHKLGVNSRAQAVAVAYRGDLVDVTRTG